MAASVLLTIGDAPNLLEQIRIKAEKILPGFEAGLMGPVIDQQSKEKIIRYIDEAVAGGAKLLVDGRGWGENKIGNPLLEKGFWVGPTVIVHSNEDDAALREEVFGPVLSVLRVKDKVDALRLQKRSEYGNAASIYTSSGAVAEWFTKRFTCGMMGVNIGVPVPREPFSFGGTQSSKFGDMDITGDGGIEFFTIRRKITTKWGPPQEASWLS
jgi:acyl-CoA reductase-like NAD-dependent aldehyde dehydrogenase